MHCVSDDEDPAGVVRALSDAMPAGSYLILSHPGIADSDAPTGAPSTDVLAAADCCGRRPRVSPLPSAAARRSPVFSTAGTSSIRASRSRRSGGRTRPWRPTSGRASATSRPEGATTRHLPAALRTAHGDTTPTHSRPSPATTRTALGSSVARRHDHLTPRRIRELAAADRDGIPAAGPMFCANCGMILWPSAREPAPRAPRCCLDVLIGRPCRASGRPVS